MASSIATNWSVNTFIPTFLPQTTRFVWCVNIVRLLIVLNALDGIFTLFWVYTGRAVEANPIMAALLHVHPVLFIGLKLAMVYFCSMLLLRYYYKALAYISIIGSFLVYLGIVTYHIVMMFYFF